MKDKKKKIGYTTGVFDMFHVGHLEIIKKAKAKCDYLIVGVSTDELVMSYKNKKPIISFEQRIEIVKSIKYVDQVVVQNHRDKIEAQKKIGFNIMFVGDDWKESKLFLELEKKFSLIGVEIFYFPYTKNISSTSLRSKLKALINDEKH
tara:strand:+ start:6529 stop:6972 length:444 start_codon:yes stop_codon:yes gene_type:complete